MRYSTQLNNLQNTLKSYKEFMPLCPTNEATVNLSREIISLNSRIKELSKMNIYELCINDPTSYIEEPSKLNFLNS